MDEAIKRQVNFKVYAAAEAAATYLHDGARLSDSRNVFHAVLAISLPSAACAAASRAIGTRNGEHDT